MKTVILSVFCQLWALAACYAQLSCDSIYAKEDRFWKEYTDKGRVGLMVFDVAPRVVFGQDRLTNYSDSKEKVGAVMYRVRIDSLGAPSCLRVVHTTNALLVAEADRIVETLKFSPALQSGQSIEATMYVTVRFYNGTPPKRHRS